MVLLLLLFGLIIAAVRVHHSFAAMSTAFAMPFVPSESSLQTYHPPLTPAEAMRELAAACERLGVTEWDVYGDFNANANGDSFLRRFEAELADELGKQDAVFMPSGVMAQSIALLIHDRNTRAVAQSSKDNTGHGMFACHPTSHLLLHEQHAYAELLHMKALVVRSHGPGPTGMSLPPMTYEDVKRTLDSPASSTGTTNDVVSTLILELPHREIGGKLTFWEDVEKIRDYCQNHNVRFHCDGARLFEAATGLNKTMQEVAAPFDSVYISFYKGLGGMSGAALLGSTDFCNEARVWLRRFGGNLYTLLPYVVSSMAGYRRYWKMDGRSADDDDGRSVLSFAEKKQKLTDVIAALRRDVTVNDIVCFDPAMPETNMIHGYLLASKDECEKSLEQAAATCGIRVLHRIREVSRNDNGAFSLGYRTRFEWTMGEANGRIPIETFLTGWRNFAESLLASTER